MDLSARRIAPALFAALATLAGCELSEAFAPAREKYEGPEVTGDATPMETEAKLSMYLRCQDSLADVLEESWQRLDGQVDERGRLRRRRRLFVYPLPESLFRTCDQTLREGPEAPPSMPETERSAEEMVEAAKKFAALTRDLDRYLEEGGLAKDDGANVQVLYPLIVDAHDRWVRNDSILSLNLNAAKRLNDPELLAQLAAAGHDVEYHARAIIIRARQLVRCIDASGPVEDDDAKDRKRDGLVIDCEDELADFDATFEEFDTFYTAERLRADKVFWMRTYAEDIQDFRVLIDRHRAALEGEGKRSTLEQRDVDAIVELYRRLFRDVDTLDFTFPAE